MTVFPAAPSRSLPPIEGGSSLASLATAYAFATRVFHRHRLDFCCHGREPLADACARRGVDVDQVLAELRAEAAPMPADQDWSQRSLGELIDYVLSRFHRGHRAELPRLLAMAEKVEHVHAHNTACPHGLVSHLFFVQRELELHMQKEETILFPMLHAGHGGHAAGPIQVMELEHEDHARNLRHLRELASDYVPPADACNTWRALYLGLEELEREVMQHVHLENHVLFPRALEA